MTTDIAIVTAGKPCVLSAWLAAWKASPNFGKWPVYVGDDGGLPRDLRDRFIHAGCSLFALDKAAEDARRRWGRFGKYGSDHKALWFTKVPAIRHCPARWCVWLDHDAEARFDIAPAVEWAVAQGKWLSAPKYASMGTGRWRGKRLTQNGFMVVDTGRDEVAEWERGMVVQLDCPNDETCIHRLFGGWASADAGIADLYRPEWYASADCFPEINQPKGLTRATERLKRDGRAAVRHWCGGWGKRVFMGLYGEKGDAI